MTHWHITANVPGYLPHTDPMTAWSEEEAIQLVRSEAEYQGEGHAGLPYVAPVFSADGLVATISSGHPRDLGVLVEAQKCEVTTPH